MRMNKRILKHKEEILTEIAKGYKPSEVGRVFEIDGRTIKHALDVWADENSEYAKAQEEVKEAEQTLKKAQETLENSLQK